jgi:hypothetical protein
VRNEAAPAVEPAAGRRRIDPQPRIDPSSPLRKVPPRIQQDVGDRVADLARRTKHMEMEPVGQNRAVSPKDAIHRPRQTRRDCLHPTRQVSRVRSLYDQVSVIALQRVVDDTESSAITCLPDRALELAHEAHGSERRNIFSDLDRYMARMSCGEWRATAMRIARVRTDLAPSSFTPAAPPGSRFQIELELRPANRHRMHSDTSM